MNKKARILLVDDDADFVDSTKTVLESKPYEVIVAVNGDEGLRKAREEKPDLILLDVIMPVEDGFTAAEQLKKDPYVPPNRACEGKFIRSLRSAASEPKFVNEHPKERPSTGGK